MCQVVSAVPTRAQVHLLLADALPASGSLGSYAENCSSFGVGPMVVTGVEQAQRVIKAPIRDHR